MVCYLTVHNLGGLQPRLQTLQAGKVGQWQDCKDTRGTKRNVYKVGLRPAVMYGLETVALPGSRAEDVRFPSEGTRMTDMNRSLGLREWGLIHLTLNQYHDSQSLQVCSKTQGWLEEGLKQSLKTSRDSKQRHFKKLPRRNVLTHQQKDLFVSYVKIILHCGHIQPTLTLSGPDL